MHVLISCKSQARSCFICLLSVQFLKLAFNLQEEGLFTERTHLHLSSLLGLMKPGDAHWAPAPILQSFPFPCWLSLTSRSPFSGARFKVAKASGSSLQLR